MSPDILEVIRTRRVAKWYADAPVPQEMLWKILEAARWAPTAGNIRKLHFVCITDGQLLRQIKMFSPGMVAGLPAALVVICINQQLVLAGDRENYIDVGLGAMNMMLAAHALGLVAGPMTSFSHEAVKILLNLPGYLEPEMFIGLGYPAEVPPDAPRWPVKKSHLEDMVQWGPFPGCSSDSQD